MPKKYNWHQVRNQKPLPDDINDFYYGIADNLVKVHEKIGGGKYLDQLKARVESAKKMMRKIQSRKLYGSIEVPHTFSFNGVLMDVTVADFLFQKGVCTKVTLLEWCENRVTHKMSVFPRDVEMGMSYKKPKLSKEKTSVNS